MPMHFFSFRMFDSLSWQKLLLTWCMLIGLANGIADHFFIAPLQAQLIELKKEMEQQKTQQQALQTSLSLWQQNASSLQELDRVMLPIQAQQQLLIGKDWLSVISGIAKIHQVQIQQLAWVERDTQSQTAQQLSLQVSGSYSALGHFYAHLVNLSHSLQLNDVQWRASVYPNLVQVQSTLLIKEL